ncbi:hypothetical protein MKU92_000661 [Salmonella enterica]|nr:hypothetical protein [Salmonella enterica subsp. enterica]EIX6431818.1 hypothetical protein [Salmonella enterica]ECF1702234.1 hypothetical protein [Salmonella enterica subsp. enterica]ECI5350540.1 hypothetical protein [Salmonella enterica subsp. enterica]EDP9823331.1 transposase family protein [Salmonella enterica subsp. enterica]
MYNLDVDHIPIVLVLRQQGKIRKKLSDILFLTVCADEWIRQETAFKAGLRRKMRKAAMDDNYLVAVLAGCGVS